MQTEEREWYSGFCKSSWIYARHFNFRWHFTDLGHKSNSTKECTFSNRETNWNATQLLAFMLKINTQFQLINDNLFWLSLVRFKHRKSAQKYDM